MPLRRTAIRPTGARVHSTRTQDDVAARIVRLMSRQAVYGVNMTKMVQLSNDAYDLLKAAKRPGESFSAVVKRLLTKRKPLDLTGLMSKKELEAADRWRSEIDALDASDDREGPGLGRAS
jgi:predicted CopG family antitoxin